MDITEEQKQKYIEELRNQVENHPKSYASYINQTGGCRHWRPDRQYLRDFIKEQTPLLCNEKFKLATKLYWILNGITSWDDPRVKCQHCGKPFDYRNVDNVLIGYPKFCCRSCQVSDESTQQKMKKTCMERYGAENAFASEIIKQRIEDTLVRKYGKHKITEVKEAIEKRKQTCMERYGTPHPFGSPIIMEKAKETCQRKYGVDNISKSDKFKDLYNDETFVKNMVQKVVKTKQINGTFNTSAIENSAFELLKIVYPDLIQHYKCEQYPYVCDFFSPSNNLFIEYNGIWTHGKKPFDPKDKDCIEQLKIWQKKAETSPFYANAVETWTVRDVAKRKCAEENHLNYKVFWTISEIVDHLNSFGFFPEFGKDRKYAVSSEIALNLYNQYGKESFKQYQIWDFPYPNITDGQLKWEIETLQSKSLTDKQFSPLIRKYHPSMWGCCKDKYMAPTIYWEKFKGVSEEKWKKFYTNRIHYAGLVCCQNGILKPSAILTGFSVLHYSNCVSYLKPFLAKRLINTYLSEFSTIFCPMNGFSGFMLGAAVGCGKQYIGQDLNAVQINEAKELSDFLVSEGAIQKDQVQLSVKDVFEDSGKYDCLVCCPPYRLKEKWNFDQDGNCLDKDLSCNEWMKVIMQHYTCRKYLFVVDDSETEFDDHIVEWIDNSSHFGSNFEKVIVI